MEHERGICDQRNNPNWRKQTGHEHKKATSFASREPVKEKDWAQQ